jgi:hypothetical protein
MTPEEQEQFKLLQILVLNQMKVIEDIVAAMALMSDTLTKVAAHHTEIQA